MVKNYDFFYTRFYTTTHWGKRYEYLGAVFLRHSQPSRVPELSSSTNKLKNNLWLLRVHARHTETDRQTNGNAILSCPVHTGNRQQIGNKVDCRRYGRLCCRFWQQIGHNLNLQTAACHGRLCCWYGQLLLCCRYGRLFRQCVRNQSNTVDFVDFQQSRRCWIQLYRQCVSGFTVMMSTWTNTKSWLTSYL